MLFFLTMSFSLYKWLPRAFIYCLKYVCGFFGLYILRWLKINFAFK